MATPKVIAATPYSKGDKNEYPIRFVVGKYRKGDNPHPYMVGMEVNAPHSNYFTGTAHYFSEEEAMNTMLRLIARHNEGHTDKWISYIPPTVRRV